MSFTYRMWLLEQMKEVEENENKQNQDNQENKQPKRFKIKEIRKIEEDNDRLDTKILLEAGACALAFITLLWMSLDNKLNITEETYFNLTNFLQVSLSVLGVKFFGLIIKDIIKKYKNKELIATLQNMAQETDDEVIIEQEESTIKRR